MTFPGAEHGVPDAAPAAYGALDVDKELRRESRDIASRLASIRHDVSFIDAVADAFYPLPVVANLRCGAWYTRPERTAGAAYFKSTDGHMHQWQFSLKRSNLHLVPLIERGAGDDEPTGCIIVDSTRRGKRFPDALSKTVPIWCTVLNTASHRRFGTPTVPELVVPQSVSPSEREQIAALVFQWAVSLLESDLEVPHLRRPLCPVFVHPPDIPPVFLGTTQHSVVLVCASDIEGPQLSPLTYVQGAGDDHESWALGLTPELYWKHAHELSTLAYNRASLSSRIEELVAEAKLSGERIEWFSAAAKNEARISGTPIDVKVCSLQGISDTDYLLKVYYSNSPVEEPASSLLCLHVSSGKRGLTDFSVRLRSTVDAVTHALDRGNGRVLLACADGQLSGALAVAVLAASFDNARQLVGASDDDPRRIDHRHTLSKDATRRRLQWLVGSGGTAPSRALLQRVNSFLIGPQRAY